MGVNNGERTLTPDSTGKETVVGGAFISLPFSPHLNVPIVQSPFIIQVIGLNGSHLA